MSQKQDGVCRTVGSLRFRKTHIPRYHELGERGQQAEGETRHGGGIPRGFVGPGRVYRSPPLVGITSTNCHAPQKHTSVLRVATLSPAAAAEKKTCLHGRKAGGWFQTTLVTALELKVGKRGGKGYFDHRQGNSERESA